MDSLPLGKTIRSAYAWVVTGTVLRHGLAFALSMMLARLLMPSDYGLVGMTAVFIGILATVQNLGIAAAVAYFNDDESKLPTYYTATAALGILLTALTLAGAPLIARFYDNEQLTPIVRALSLLLLMGGFKSVSEARLARSFQFKRLMLIENIVGLSSGAIAVGMAAAGFGAWSLVGNWLLVAALQTGSVLYMLPPRFTLRPDGAVLKKALRYGLPQTGSMVLWKIYDSSDYLVIGKLLGSGPLGVYTLAFRMATLVNEKVSAIVNRVSFNTFAALKDDREHGAAHWLSLTDKVATVNFALLALVAVLGEDIVLVVLGSKWAAAVLPMRILCAVGAIKTLSSITTSLLNGNGRTSLVFAVTITNTVVMPAAFAIACILGGVVGVAIAWCVLLPASALYLTRRAAGVAGIGMGRYFRTLRSPALTAAACLAGSLPAAMALEPGLSRLLIAGGLGALCGGLMLLRHPFVKKLYGEWTSKRAAHQATAVQG
jgi:PST family polysaccharide transporter